MRAHVIPLTYLKTLLPPPALPSLPLCVLSPLLACLVFRCPLFIIYVLGHVLGLATVSIPGALSLGVVGVIAREQEVGTPERGCYVQVDSFPENASEPAGRLCVCRECICCPAWTLLSSKSGPGSRPWGSRFGDKNASLAPSWRDAPRTGAISSQCSF